MLGSENAANVPEVQQHMGTGRSSSFDLGEEEGRLHRDGSIAARCWMTTSLGRGRRRAGTKSGMCRLCLKTTKNPKWLEVGVSAWKCRRNVL